MSTNARKPDFKMAAFGLIRDKNGKPRVDDPENLHPGIHSMLTADERRGLGLWDGVLIRDAKGIKRASLVSQTDRQITLDLVDDIVAGNFVYIDGVERIMSPRFDASAGKTLIINIED